MDIHIYPCYLQAVYVLLVGAVENILGDGASLIGQMIICGLMITGVEFIVGMIVNRQMHLNVWDYSGQQYNFKGQVCLLYTNLWILLSCPVIVLHDYMEYILLGSQLPNYKIW